MGGGDGISRSDSHIILRSLSHIWRSDEEWGARIAQKHHGFTEIKRVNSSKCFIYFFILIAVSCFAAFVFADLLLCAAKPKLTLHDLHVTRLSSAVANNVASLKLTAAAELNLYNDDLGSFRYSTGTIAVLYGNTTLTLGKANIKGGVVPGRKSARINAVVEIKADTNKSSFVSDVGSTKLVQMQLVAQLRGNVRVVKVIRMHRTSFMNCTLTLNLTTKALQDWLC